MIVRGLNKEKIAEAITRDLPFGIWCADFGLRTVTGYNKFCELLETDRNELRFDELTSFVREDYRSVVMLSAAELTSGAEIEITAPTNHRWIHLKMTHFDIDTQRAYGYIIECSHAEEKPSSTKEDTAVTLSKETELISRAVDHLEGKAPEEAITHIIEDLCRALNADRISMIEYNFMNKTQSFSNGTSNYGVTSRKNLINDLLLESTPWLNAEMDKHKPLYIYDSSSLDTDKRTQLEILCCQEGQTVFFQPLVQHEQTFGYLIIDFLNKKREVSQAEMGMIKTVGRVISFGSKLATTESKYMNEEDILHTMINVMPFGYLQMRYTYKANGEHDGLTIVRVNNKLTKMLGIKGLSGMTVEQAFGSESDHIMAVCNKIAKDGQKTVVDDLMYVNGKNISADVFMPNYNEFICLTAENSDTIYNANNLKNHHMGVDHDRPNHILSEIQQAQRTHLNTILGFAELMAAEQDETQKEKYMSIIKENAQSLLDSTVIKEAMQTEEETSEKAANAKAEDSNRRKKILIAEDTESNFMLIQYILKNDYDLEWARDGIEALEKYEQDKPDIILMDVRMPRMSGITATSRIREKDQITPIIALTAFAFESDKQKTLEAGCTDFMSKPINTKALREMIKKYI